MFLEVSQLEVRYAGRSQAAVQGVTLGLRAGDIGVLIGPSGCGKTTLLRCIAGLERARAGRLTVNGEVWQDEARGQWLPPHRRALGYVFQEASLFEHLDVLGNLRYGLKRARSAQAGAACVSARLPPARHPSDNRWATGALAAWCHGTLGCRM